MGSQLYRVTSIRIIMKFFILASLLALAAAEADPQVFYNTYGYYPSLYTGYTGYTGYTQPWTCSQSNRAVYGGYYHHLAKRDAEAEADPYVFYQTHGYYPSWYTGYAAYTHQVAPVVYTQPKVQVQKVEPVEYKVQQPVTYSYPTVQTHPVTYTYPTVQTPVTYAYPTVQTPMTYTYPTVQATTTQQVTPQQVFPALYKGLYKTLNRYVAKKE